VYETKEEASTRERQVKAWKSKKKITELIQNVILRRPVAHPD